MKKRTILISLLFVGMLYSCGGDDDVSCEDTTSIQNQINTASDNANEAVLAFNNDQSDDNCNNLERALNDFIDVLESLQDCADQSGQGQQFSDDITQARDNLSQLSC